MPTLQDDRILVRPWTVVHDAAAAFVMYGDPEVNRYIGARTYESVEALHTAMTGWVERYLQWDNYRYGSWAVIDKENSELVGTMLLKPIPLVDGTPSGDIEVGWHVARKYWGNGYATAMGRLGLQYAFGDLQLTQIVAVVEPPNTASQKVALKLGMNHVGQTDRYYRKEPLETYWINNEQWFG